MKKFNLDNLSQKHFNIDFNTAIDKIIQKYLDPKTKMLQSKLKPKLVCYYISCDMIDIAIHEKNTWDLDIDKLLSNIEINVKSYIYKKYVPKVEIKEKHLELDF